MARMNIAEVRQMIVVFDLETTGLDPQSDRIVQFAGVKVDEEFKEVDRMEMLIDPGLPIPPEATAVNNITNEKVKDALPFEAVASTIYDFMYDCDLGGFNILAFDIPFIQRELRDCNLQLQLNGKRIIDASEMFRRMAPMRLIDALRFYCGETHRAHDALEDTVATVDVIKAQFERYEELDSVDTYHSLCWGNRIDMAGKFHWNEADVAVFSFGKHAGQPLALCRGYLNWMLKNEFSEDTKQIARRVLDGTGLRREQ